MFLLESVILSIGGRGLCLGVSLDRDPLDRDHPDRDPPQTETPRHRPPCIVKSGQYASYWNAGVSVR